MAQKTPANRTLLEDILTGEHDDLLAEIVSAATERRKYLAKIEIVNINPGDTIRFLNTCKPTYLRGVTAVVKKVNGASVVVDIDLNPRYGRFSGSKNVRCPASIIEKV